MPSPVEFRTVTAESTFLDPRKGFEPTTVAFQVRIDPLTGRTGHFSHFGTIKPQKLPFEAYETPDVKGFCPFCPDNRQKYTPRFLPEIAREGRLTRNEAFLIPNLFPYDVYSSVLIMTDDHVVRLGEFTRQRLHDSFTLGTEFLKKVNALTASPRYHIMTWNYMPPSGGGLVHPHQQYFATECPGNQFTDELDGSKRFYETHGLSFWNELIREEHRTGMRFIGKTGSSCWLSSFVSLGLLGDILCIFPDVFHLEQLGEQHIDDLTQGLLSIFAYFEQKDIFSFNASLFFGPEHQEYFPCHFRIVPRTFLNMRDFAPDYNFFQAVLSEPVSVVMPEDLCNEIKGYLNGNR